MPPDDDFPVSDNFRFRILTQSSPKKQPRPQRHASYTLYPGNTEFYPYRSQTAGLWVRKVVGHTHRNDDERVKKEKMFEV